MGKINQLPRNIWELIAAGEVVERPASVVKELLENSIDAGATSITIEIMSGGIKYIRITDNGCGISREDVPIAFLSHATSKISAADDLDAINTLGFRGEALSSVAAVSRVEVITKTKDESVGTIMEVQGGEQISVDDAGCPNGTTIIIRDLFFNTPARMKFLKSDKSEGMAVSAIVDKIALSHPEISVRFIKDGKQAVSTNGSGDLKNAVFAVYGKEFSSSLIPVEYELNGIFVNGFVSKPFYSRGSGSMQLFFVNNRFIKSKTACAALNEAYKNSIMVGKYPACVLFLEIMPELVDVNVHPAKTEVRFSNEKAVFDAVYYSAKSAISADVSRPQLNLKVKKDVNILEPSSSEYKQERIESFVNEEKNAFKHKETDNRFVNDENKNTIPFLGDNKRNNSSALYVFNSDYDDIGSDNIDLTIKNVFATQEDVKISDDKLNNVENNDNLNIEASDCDIDFKYLGEAFKTYIFAEYNGKLIIIDKHAAHERMIYNSLKENTASNASQLLLKPVNVTLSKEEYTAVINNREILDEFGFETDDFGNGTVIVRACPIILEKEDISSLISEIASYLISNKKDILPEKLDWIYHSMACRAAVKAGNKSSDYELIEFTKKLLSDESIRYCPHGRPVLIELTKYEIDKQFGRV